MTNEEYETAQKVTKALMRRFRWLGDDFFAAGLLGCVEAMKTHDATKGKLAVWMHICARQEMSRLFRKERQLFGTQRADKGHRVATTMESGHDYIETVCVAEGPSPDELAGTSLQVERVRELLPYLPTIERDLIDRHFFGDEPLDAIARSWGINVNGSINFTKKRALALLAKWMKHGPPEGKYRPRRAANAKRIVVGAKRKNASADVMPSGGWLLDITHEGVRYQVFNKVYVDSECGNVICVSVHRGRRGRRDLSPVLVWFHTKLTTFIVPRELPHRSPTHNDLPWCIEGQLARTLEAAYREYKTKEAA